MGDTIIAATYIMIGIACFIVNFDLLKSKNFLDRLWVSFIRGLLWPVSITLDILATLFTLDQWLKTNEWGSDDDEIGGGRQ